MTHSQEKNLAAGFPFHSHTWQRNTESTSHVCLRVKLNNIVSYKIHGQVNCGTRSILEYFILSDIATKK